LGGRITDGREPIRLLIVILLFTIFGGTIGSAIYAIFLNSGVWANYKDLLDLILPVETALIGTAVAFYMTN
jgi:hypothetical protein